MVFEIRTRGFTLTSALAEAIELRSRAIKASWQDQLTRLDISLSDANGPKGGVDKVCKVRCELAGSETLFAESMALDMYDAIHNSFDKIKRRINKQLKRRMSKKQRRGHWPRWSPENTTTAELRDYQSSTGDLSDEIQDMGPLSEYNPLNSQHLRQAAARGHHEPFEQNYWLSKQSDSATNSASSSPYGA
jgi:ribosomal subunit interface protein